MTVFSYPVLKVLVLCERVCQNKTSCDRRTVCYVIVWWFICLLLGCITVLHV